MKKNNKNKFLKFFIRKESMQQLVLDVAGQRQQAYVLSSNNQNILDKVT